MSGGVLPTGWTSATLDELVLEKAAITDGPFGSNLKTEHYTESGPRVVRLQNIGDGVFLDARAHISEEHFATLAKHQVEPGDVLVASLGEVLPRACTAPQALGPAIVKADCIRVRPGPATHARFVMHMLNAPQVRAEIARQIQGVGRPRVNLSTLRALRIPVPPVREQERIVDELERRLSHLDAATHGMAAARRRLNHARQAVLAVALSGDFTGGQQGWRRVELGDITVSTRNGIFVSRPAATPPGVPIYRVGSVRPRRLDTDDLRYAAVGDEAAGYLVSEGDLLFIRYNGNADLVGACARVPRSGAGVLHPDKLIRVVVDPDVAEPAFVEIAMCAGEGLAAIRSKCKTTAGQVGIAGSALKTVPFRLPPLEVQREIVNEVDRQTVLIAATERAIEASLRKADQLRQSLLAAAFSGRLVPQDPNDESAEALLERIRAEREAATPAKKPRRKTKDATS